MVSLDEKTLALEALTSDSAEQKSIMSAIEALEEIPRRHAKPTGDPEHDYAVFMKNARFYMILEYIMHRTFGWPRKAMVFELADEVEVLIGDKFDYFVPHFCDPDIKRVHLMLPKETSLSFKDR